MNQHLRRSRRRASTSWATRSDGKMAECGGHAPHPAGCGTISLAKNPGTLVRFTFHGPGGRTRTRTGRGLSSLPLHWATPAKSAEGWSGRATRAQPDQPSEKEKNGGPGRIRTVNLPIQSRMLYLVELRGWGMKWSADLSRPERYDSPTKVSAPSFESGLINGTRTRTAAFTGRDAALTS